MKKVINADYYSVDGQVLPINCVKGSGCYIEILEAISIYSQLLAMLNHHCKVLVIRVDVHLSNNPATNKQMSTILRKFKRRLSNKGYLLKRLGYVWAREATKDGSVHYHLVYMIDGNKIKSSFNVNQLLDEVCMFVDTKINLHYPTKGKSSYRMINRANVEQFCEVFRWLSYLAKERSKGVRQPTTNDYSSSRYVFEIVP